MKLAVTALALALAAAPARSADLVFAVSTGSNVPMTEFRDNQLSGGILKLFGDALAHELGYQAQYVTLPRKRVEAAVLGPGTDLVCDLRPEWVEHRQLLWSDAIFTNTMIIATRTDTAPLRSLGELAGRRTGTVLGYRYPELDATLGPRFLRDDAVNDELNLDKLLRHRFDYLSTNAIFYDYQRAVHPERARLNPVVFRIRAFDTYCAIPAQDSKITLAELNAAIGSLKRRGTIQAILNRFAPAQATRLADRFALRH